MSENSEEDPWDKRIAQTGCAQENEALQICRYDTGDWRQCLKEMKAFRDCWTQHKNQIGVPLSASGEDYNLTGVTHDR